MLTLSELIERRGLPLMEAQKIKMMRHVDDPGLLVPLADLSREHFEEFQSYQSALRLRDKKWLVSFHAWPGLQARLEGIYEVGVCHQRGDWQLTDSFPCRDRQRYANEVVKKCYFYELKRDQRFSDLEGRVVIQWPDPIPTHWHISYLDKFAGCPVVEILPEGYSRNFPGFGPLIIEYEELKSIFKNPEAYRQWQSQLESVGGVYLITAENGHQYVGSASGKRGIWGRWGDYAKNPTGGNEVLKKLLKKSPGIEATFKFSVLRTFDLGTDRSEAVQMEEQLRRKLGDRTVSLR